MPPGSRPADPHGEVELARRCYQRRRTIYTGPQPAARANLRDGAAGLGCTLRAWRTQILASFDTHGLSNGGTEAINLLIEKARRLAHGYRSFTNHRLRMLLAASGQRTYRRSRPPRSGP